MNDLNPQRGDPDVSPVTGDREVDRQKWIQALDEMRANAIIDDDDQNALIRHYDEHRLAIDAELAEIAPEYQRRVEADGMALADEWIVDKALAIGQRDGEGARRLLDQLNAVRNAAQQDLIEKLRPSIES